MVSIKIKLHIYYILRGYLLVYILYHMNAIKKLKIEQKSCHIFVYHSLCWQKICNYLSTKRLKIKQFEIYF